RIRISPVRDRVEKPLDLYREIPSIEEQNVSGKRRELAPRAPENARSALQIAALKMMKGRRRLDQRLQKLALSAFGRHPDFLQRFVALKKPPGVEHLDPAQVLSRQIVHPPNQ